MTDRMNDADLEAQVSALSTVVLHGPLRREVLGTRHGSVVQSLVGCGLIADEDGALDLRGGIDRSQWQRGDPDLREIVVAAVCRSALLAEDVMCARTDPGEWAQELDEIADWAAHVIETAVV